LINLNEAKLSKMKIIAPFSGVISEKNIEIGDMSNNSEKALLKLVSNEKKLLLAFDSKFAQDVKVGDKFCINSNKEENKTCVEIYKVYPTLNSEKKLNAEAFGVDLKVGNFGDGSIIKGN
jgi:multidrug resistance efflux pump